MINVIYIDDNEQHRFTLGQCNEMFKERISLLTFDFDRHIPESLIKQMHVAWIDVVNGAFIDGPKFANHFKKINPKLKIILLTANQIPGSYEEDLAIKTAPYDEYITKEGIPGWYNRLVDITSGLFNGTRRTHQTA